MTYIIILTSELDLVDFSELVEDNKNTVRKSNDGTKSVLSWDDEEYPETPPFFYELSYYEGPYINLEIFNVVNGPEWVK